MSRSGRSGRRPECRETDRDTEECVHRRSDAEREGSRRTCRHHTDEEDDVSREAVEETRASYRLELDILFHDSETDTVLCSQDEERLQSEVPPSPALCSVVVLPLLGESNRTSGGCPISIKGTKTPVRLKQGHQ